MDSHLNCPDCGQEMVPAAVSGFDKSYRCNNCGGFWMEGWVANRVAEGQMNEFAEVKADIKKFTGRTNACPVDKTSLFGYNGEEMPPDVVAFKCSHCGWWWFPDGNLLKFKKAYEARKSYFSLWKKKSEAALLVLPVLMVLVLVVGLGLSVFSVTSRQRAGVEAGSGRDSFRAEYVGAGVERIRFWSEDEGLRYVLLKKLGTDTWGPTEIIAEGQGWYRAELVGLEENQVYQLQAGKARYYFQTQ